MAKISPEPFQQSQNYSTIGPDLSLGLTALGASFV